MRPADDGAHQVELNTGLKVVGRLDRLPPTYQNPNKDQFDKTFTSFLVRKGIHDRYSEYGVCRATEIREQKAVSRYSLPTVDQPPTAVELGKIMDWLALEFGPYVDGHRVIDFEDVDIQWSTTPGIPYKWYCRTKAESTDKFRADILAFWKYAHLIGDDVLWHNFVKVELLPTSKLETDNVRSITGPDIAYHYSYCRMVQDFNHRLYSTADKLQTSSMLGFNKFGGGLNRLARKMNELPHKEESDMSKYDARQPRWLRLLCRDFRWFTMRPEDKTMENWHRLRYYYEQSINSKVVLGKGWVLSTDHGMKSGDPNTSADNTLIHFIVLSLAYMRLVSDDYSHFKQNVRAALYGDDELISLSDEVVYHFCAQQRGPIYEACGVHMKVEETKTSDYLEGMTFLGNRFKIEPETGMYVGVPVDPRKAIASLLKPPNPQKAGQSLTRAVALLCESFWYPPNRDLLFDYIRELVSEGVEMDLRVNWTSDEDVYDMSMFKGRVPTYGILRNLWLGFE